MKLKTHDMQKLPLQLFEYLGIRSETNSRRAKMISFVLSLLVLQFGVVIVMQFPYITGPSEFAINVEGFVAFVEVFGRLVIIVYQEKQCDNLLKSTERFWSIDNCDGEVKAQLNRIVNGSMIFQKLFIACEIIVCSTLGLYSLIVGSLPFGTWKFEGHDSLYRLEQFLQFGVVSLAELIVPAFDSIFWAFCADIIIQFKILCHCIKELKNVSAPSREAQMEYQSRMKMYIRHHQYLLRFLKEFQDYYSSAILMVYLFASPLICIELYTVFEGDEIKMKVRPVGLILCVIMQLLMYSLPGDYITSSGLALADAVYDSDWQSHNSDIRCYVNFVTQMAQQPIVIKTLGMFELKSAIIPTFLRVAWSICTVMRGLKEM